MSDVVTIGKRAKHRPQRGTGSGTTGSDCGVRICGQGIDHASRGRVTWSSAKAEVRWIRRIMGKPKGATTVGDALKVLRSPELAKRFAAVGLQPPRVMDRRGAQWITIRHDLDAGTFVGLAIRRSVWLAEGLPPDRSDFPDGHMVGLFGLEPDPVDPPRDTFASCPLMGGWTDVPFHKLRAPAGRFGKRPWGEGRAEAYAVGRAKPLVVVPPKPDPVPDPIDRAIADMLAAADEDEATAAALESQAQTLRTRATARRVLATTLKGG